MQLVCATRLDWVRAPGRLLPLFGLVLLFLWPDAAPAADEVRHTLSFSASREQLILMRSEFPVSGPVTELIMPNWTPGSYLIRDFAANVDRISAVSEDGRKLQLQRRSVFILERI